MSAHIDLLKTLFTFEQEALHDYLFDVLLGFYKEEEIIEDYGQFLFAKGDIDVLLVAHLDTVHKTKPTIDEVFYDQEKGVIWSPRGIGGDDRCGVYIILNILFSGLRPHIAFTWNEEIGCVGSRNMVNIFDPRKTMNTKINFAIQFDRRGHQEAVYYDLDHPDFEKYITSFGFETKLGSFTDICEICPDWECAGVNLSAGYANEHTTNEMVFVATIQDTFTKACNILRDQVANPKAYEYIETPKRPFMPSKGSYGYEGAWWEEEDDDAAYQAWKNWEKPKAKKMVDGRECCEICEQPTPWYSFCEEFDLQKVCKSCYNINIGNYYEDEFCDFDDEDDGNDLIVTPNYSRTRGVY